MLIECLEATSRYWRYYTHNCPGSTSQSTFVVLTYLTVYICCPHLPHSLHLLFYTWGWRRCSTLLWKVAWRKYLLLQLRANFNYCIGEVVGMEAGGSRTCTVKRKQMPAIQPPYARLIIIWSKFLSSSAFLLGGLDIIGYRLTGFLFLSTLFGNFELKNAKVNKRYRFPMRCYMQPLQHTIHSRQR